MKIAFQKNGSSAIAKIIQWWTKSQYYHVELVFEDKIAFTADTTFKKFGTFFYEFYYDNYDINNWEVLDLNISEEDELKIRHWCETENGCWYDLIGLVFTQVIPLSFQNPYWWFCSEVCHAALQQNLGWFPSTKSHQIDPFELYNMVRKQLLYNH